MVAEDVQSRQKAVWYLLVGAIAIGLAPIFARLAVTQGHVGSIAAGFWRMFIGAIGFAALSILRREDRATFNQSLRAVFELGLVPALVAGVMFACDLIAWHISFEYTSVANSTLIANLSSLMVPTCGVLIFGEVFRKSLVVGGLSAICGVVFLVLGGSHPAGLTHSEYKYLGDGLAFLTAFFYTGYMLSTKSLAKMLAPRALMLVVSSVSAVILLVASCLLSSPVFPSTGVGCVWVIALGLVPQVIGQGLVAKALTALPVSMSALMLLFAPVSTTIFGAIILDQQLSVGQMIGMVFTVIGIAIVGSRR